jgi:hypothetical protein
MGLRVHVCSAAYLVSLEFEIFLKSRKACLTDRSAIQEACAIRMRTTD